MTTVLVIEDDLAIRRGLRDALRHEGYGVLEAGDAVEGQRLALAAEIGLVLLDLVLPGGNGLGVLERIREARPNLPVIVLTARGGEDDRVRGPAPGRRRLRRQAVQRPRAAGPRRLRAAALAGEDGRCGHPSGSSPSGRRQDRPPRPGGAVRGRDGDALSPLEADLLRYLAGNAHRATSREELLQWIWKVNPRHVQTRSVDMAVARLRRKLRDDDDPRAFC